MVQCGGGEKSVDENGNRDGEVRRKELKGEFEVDGKRRGSGRQEKNIIEVVLKVMRKMRIRHG